MGREQLKKDISLIIKNKFDIDMDLKACRARSCNGFSTYIYSNCSPNVLVRLSTTMSFQIELLSNTIKHLFVEPAKRQINSFRGNYSFLSNFSAYGFNYKNIYFKNSEQAYQWEKAELQSDKDLILNANSAGETKKIGHRIKVDIKKWDENKVNIMKNILTAKFNVEHLKQRLLNTGDIELVEGNYWHDQIWGNCMCPKCKNKEGENNLGKILMEIRLFYLTG